MAEFGETDRFFEDEFQPVRCLFGDGVGEKANCDVGLDAFRFPVKDGAHSQIMFVHPKGFFDLPEPAVPGQDFSDCEALIVRDDPM